MILEGKTFATQLRASLAQRAERVQNCLKRPITLCAIGSTEDYGAYVYLKKEVQAAEKLGVKAYVHEVNKNTSVPQFLDLLQKNSLAPDIDALLIARPLPQALAESNYAHFIAPEKDIDGMSNISLGNLFLCKTWEEVKNLNTFVPCTAMAVLHLLDYHKISLQGIETAVIGRSSTVGRPLAHLLSCRNATVKLCHSFTTDLKTSLQNCQLICSAVGKAGLLSGHNTPPNSTVIDIATNLDANGNLCGDAKWQELTQQGCRVSPVPGGVGPITLACLLENIILSGERKL
ncbi:MAG: bifunctional 5,10-methylenetetrahydrofolate dehydrogenase/5,10-methenyltetrahydrofolate cyclohydrolase [Elusimicrobiaceae bacterium]|nr:bifunctional 5,10-methylenetetrahydrofolate dehydrogenase/5,10-methenyltetrahydrofolate cyclohydrolase [Elusimicrobiaceae bacterium]